MRKHHPNLTQTILVTHSAGRANEGNWGESFYSTMHHEDKKLMDSIVEITQEEARK